jgi:hypothetical protein
MNLLAFIVLSATKATLRDGSQTVCSNTSYESTPSRVNVSDWGSILMPYNIGPFAWNALCAGVLVCIFVERNEDILSTDTRQSLSRCVRLE